MKKNCSPIQTKLFWLTGCALSSLNCFASLFFAKIIPNINQNTFSSSDSLFSRWANMCLKLFHISFFPSVNRRIPDSMCYLSSPLIILFRSFEVVFISKNMLWIVSKQLCILSTYALGFNLIFYVFKVQNWMTFFVLIFMNVVWWGLLKQFWF